MVSDHTTTTKPSKFIYPRVECPELVEGHAALYIVECSDNTLYTGSSENLIERLGIHNSGRAAKWTKIRRPVQLVYYEIYDDLLSARRRELQIKSWIKNKKENLISGKWGKK